MEYKMRTGLQQQEPIVSRTTAFEREKDVVGVEVDLGSSQVERIGSTKLLSMRFLYACCLSLLY